MKRTRVTIMGMFIGGIMIAASPALSQETAPAPASAVTSTMTGPSAAAPAAPAAATAAAAAAPKKNDRTSYFVFKGGEWSLQDEDVKDSGTGTYWEIAFGDKFNPYIGTEFGIGYMSTEGKFFSTATKVQSIPLNLSLRLGIPIAIVEPYVLLGGGLYLNTIEVGSASTTKANLGYQYGLGVDLNLGAFVVGLEGRRFVMKGEALGETVDLDGSTIALKAGFRF